MRRSYENIGDCEQSVVLIVLIILLTSLFICYYYYYLFIHLFMFSLRQNTLGQSITIHHFWILANKTQMQRRMRYWGIWCLGLGITLKLIVYLSVGKANQLLLK